MLAPMSCGCLPTVEKTSRLVRIAGGKVPKSAKAGEVTAAGGVQLMDVVPPCTPGAGCPVAAAAVVVPIDDILR